jgi:hypothetical protein
VIYAGCDPLRRIVQRVAPWRHTLLLLLLLRQRRRRGCRVGGGLQKWVLLLLLLRQSLAVMGKECRWHGSKPCPRTHWHPRGRCKSRRQRRHHASYIAAC